MFLQNRSNSAKRFFLIRLRIRNGNNFLLCVFLSFIFWRVLVLFHEIYWLWRWWRFLFLKVGVREIKNRLKQQEHKVIKLKDFLTKQKRRKKYIRGSSSCLIKFWKFCLCFSQEINVGFLLLLDCWVTGAKVFYKWLRLIILCNIVLSWYIFYCHCKIENINFMWSV